MTAIRKRQPAAEADYVLDDQVGFLLRQAQQRQSQNQLGRLTAMDAATIKGVIDRLTKRGVTATTADPADGRRLLVALTAQGEAIFARGKPMAERITAATLEPLSEAERASFVALLRRLA